MCRKTLTESNIICCSGWNPEENQEEHRFGNLNIMPAVKRLVKFNYWRLSLSVIARKMFGADL